MGIFDKMLEKMNLDDDIEGDFFDDDYEEEEKPAPKKAEVRAAAAPAHTGGVAAMPRTGGTSKITPMRGPRRAVMPTTQGGAGAMEVCVIKPSSFDDVREITDTILSGRTVILNMEGIDMGLAQRIIDFMSGACYAVEGNLQKVANFIFVLTPRSIDISGDLQGLIEGLDFSVQSGN